MKIFKKESLENLRQRIDLVEVMSQYITMSRSGASYKALCPFHDEKTPSFIVQTGDTHYHCYGCGAHGDAIAFLMNFQKVSFQEAVESLAQRFNVILELEDKRGEGGESIDKKPLREALEKALQFFHFCLLHTKEGHEALNYLYKRGLDLNFLTTFKIGFAPRGNIFQKGMLEQRVTIQHLKDTGLLSSHDGRERDFFSDRIMIPIHDALGNPIGFSARKFKEETFGPKYINTPETPLFKKSKVLFGLNYSRRKIAKEKKVIIVEGQFDALSLINAGFDYTVAGQGTAFGEGHVRELVNLGVAKAFLALDPDNAGQEAAEKIGNLLQKEAVDCAVVTFPEKCDPDEFVRKNGKEAFEKLLKESPDYLKFLVNKYAKNFDLKSPAGKNGLIAQISKKIEEWEHPLLVHESLKRLAELTETPDTLVLNARAPSFAKTVAKTAIDINPDKILEGDLLRWLFITGDENLILIAKRNLKESDFKTELCRRFFKIYLERFDTKKELDLISWNIALENEEEKQFFCTLIERKVNKEKAKELFINTVQKILERGWMEERENLKNQILSSKALSEEQILLVKQFDELKSQKPSVSV